MAHCHIAFVMDPIATFNTYKDSTLAMIRAAQQRGWRISVLGVGDLAFQHAERSAGRGIWRCRQRRCRASMR